jgi:hypothetical protein
VAGVGVAGVRGLAQRVLVGGGEPRAGAAALDGRDQVVVGEFREAIAEDHLAPGAVEDQRHLGAGELLACMIRTREPSTMSPLTRPSRASAVVAWTARM